MKRKKKAVQTEFEWRSHGGAREGAGRKPAGARAGVSHRQRCAVARSYPVHVTVRLKDGLPRLRDRKTDRVLRDAFAKGCERFGFRLIEYSVQDNHMHFITEANGRPSLARGMQGLMIRIAKALNKLWQRRGTVFADRYHDHVLKTPREVRNALAYVLHNARKHGRRIKLLDRFTSGFWFRGWRQQVDPGADHLVDPGF